MKMRNNFNVINLSVWMLLGFVAISATPHALAEAKTNGPRPPSRSTTEHSYLKTTVAADQLVRSTAPSEPAGPKICVAAPKTNLMPAETAPESLRNSVVKYLSGPAAEILALDALVAIQQQAEAAEKGCAFFLTMSVMQKKKGGGEGFGDFLKNSANAAPLLTDLGASKTAQTVSSVATRSQAKLTTAGDLAITIKAKDEVAFEYNLLNVQTMASAAKGTIKTKAARDGEDVLSGPLEQAVSAVLTAALRK